VLQRQEQVQAEQEQVQGGLRDERVRRGENAV